MKSIWVVFLNPLNSCIQHLWSSRGFAAGTEAACAGGAAGPVPVQAQPKETGAEAQMGWGNIRRWSVPNGMNQNGKWLRDLTSMRQV